MRYQISHTYKIGELHNYQKVKRHKVVPVHAVTPYTGTKDAAHQFLTLLLGESECSVSYSTHFTPTAGAPSIH